MIASRFLLSTLVVLLLQTHFYVVMANSALTVHSFDIQLASYAKKENVQVAVWTEHYDGYVSVDELDDEDKAELALVSYNVQIDCPAQEKTVSPSHHRKPAAAGTCNAAEMSWARWLWMLVEVFILIYPRMAWMFLQNAWIRSHLTALTEDTIDAWIADHTNEDQDYVCILVSSQDVHDHLTWAVATLDSYDSAIRIGTIHGHHQSSLVQRLGIDSWPILFLLHKSRKIMVRFDDAADQLQAFLDQHKHAHLYGTPPSEPTGCRVHGSFQTHVPYFIGSLRVAIADPDHDLSQLPPEDVLSHVFRGQYFGALPGYEYFWHNTCGMAQASYQVSNKYSTDPPHITIPLQGGQEEAEEDGDVEEEEEEEELVVMMT